MEGKIPPTAMAPEAIEQQEGGQRKHRQKRIVATGDPCHYCYKSRMHGEKERQ